MKNLSLRVLLLSAALAVASAASAVPIRYTVQGIGTGRFDGVDFSGALVTLTGLSDTSQVTFQSGFYCASLATNTVTVEGVGADTITGPLAVAAQPGADFVGFGAIRLPDGGPAVFAASDSSLNGYDLQSSIGPVAGLPAYTPQLELPSEKGLFRLDEVSSATFTAQVVPEPAPMVALFLGVLAVRRSRRK